MRKEENEKLFIKSFYFNFYVHLFFLFISLSPKGRRVLYIQYTIHYYYNFIIYISIFDIFSLRARTTPQSQERATKNKNKNDVDSYARDCDHIQTDIDENLNMCVCVKRLRDSHLNCVEHQLGVKDGESSEASQFSEIRRQWRQQ